MASAAQTRGPNIMIVMLESQFEGFEHVEVNAALLETMRLALPKSRWLFFGEADHLKQVATRINLSATERENLKPVRLWSRQQSKLRKIPHNADLLFRVMREASRQLARVLVLSSITRPDLLTVKALARAFPQLPIVAVSHDAGAFFDGRGFQGGRLLSPLFRGVLMRGWPSNLRLVVLSDALRENLLEDAPDLERWVCALPHPLLPGRRKDRGHKARQNKIFGSPGVAHRDKGSQVFFRAAQTIASGPVGDRAAFVQIGPITDPELSVPQDQAVRIPSPEAPLDRPAFDALMDTLDYALLLHDAQAYGHRASGAFFDALGHGVPVLATPTPTLVDAFALEPEIGFLVNGEDDLLARLNEILAGADDARYPDRVEALKRVRHAHEPEALAPRFEAILSDLATEMSR
jgi:glycosyltransferase involved in cell wall biosynthesis